VDGDRFEVLGAGCVTVIDAGPATAIAVAVDPTNNADGSIALSGVQLHVLSAGCTFDLTDRRPV
jgi:cyanophycinase